MSKQNILNNPDKDVSEGREAASRNSKLIVGNNSSSQILSTDPEQEKEQPLFTSTRQINDLKKKLKKDEQIKSEQDKQEELAEIERLKEEAARAAHDPMTDLANIFINDAELEFLNIIRGTNGRSKTELSKGPTKGDLVDFELNSVDYDYKGMDDEEIQEKHVLNQFFDEQNLKNIPPPVRDLFRHLTDHMIQKDIRTTNWRNRLQARNDQLQKACIITNGRVKQAHNDAQNNHAFFQRKLKEVQEKLQKETKVKMELVDEKVTQLRTKVNQDIEGMLQRVAGVSAKFNTNMERITTQNREVDDRFMALHASMTEELNKKVLQVGKDIQVTLMDDDNGDWTNFKENPVNELYQLEPKQVFEKKSPAANAKKPKSSKPGISPAFVQKEDNLPTFDELEDEPSKIVQVKGKVNLQYYAVQRMKWLEKDINYKTNANKGFIEKNCKRIEENSQRIEGILNDLKVKAENLSIEQDEFSKKEERLNAMVSALGLSVGRLDDKEAKKQNAAFKRGSKEGNKSSQQVLTQLGASYNTQSGVNMIQSETSSPRKEENENWCALGNNRNSDVLNTKDDQVLHELEALRGYSDEIDVLIDNVALLRHQLLPQMREDMHKKTKQDIGAATSQLRKKMKQKTRVLGKRIDHVKNIINGSKKGVENMQEVMKYHTKGIDIINQGMGHNTTGHRDKVAQLKKKFPVVSFDQEKMLRKLESFDSPDENESVSSAESNDPEDYMQCYVQKTLKHKIDPLEKLLNGKINDVDFVTALVKQFETELLRQDNRWEGICKALLQTNGMIVKDLSSHNIYKEYQKVIVSKAPGKTKTGSKDKNPKEMNKAPTQQYNLNVDSNNDLNLVRSNTAATTNRQLRSNATVNFSPDRSPSLDKEALEWSNKQSKQDRALIQQIQDSGVIGTKIVQVMADIDSANHTLPNAILPEDVKEIVNEMKKNPLVNSLTNALKKLLEKARASSIGRDEQTARTSDPSVLSVPTVKLKSSRIHAKSGNNIARHSKRHGDLQSVPQSGSSIATDNEPSTSPVRSNNRSPIPLSGSGLSDQRQLFNPQIQISSPTDGQRKAHKRYKTIAESKRTIAESVASFEPIDGLSKYPRKVHERNGHVTIKQKIQRGVAVSVSAMNHGQTVHHRGTSVQKESQRTHKKYGSRIQSAIQRPVIHVSNQGQNTVQRLVEGFDPAERMQSQPNKIMINVPSSTDHVGFGTNSSMSGFPRSTTNNRAINIAIPSAQFDNLNFDAAHANQRAEQLDLNSMASHGTLGVHSARQPNRVRPFTGNQRSMPFPATGNSTTRNVPGIATINSNN